MAFKIAARTILQLGGELISSDGIAFYELVKNAFDARSKRVAIDIDVAIRGEGYRSLTSVLRERLEVGDIPDHEQDALRTRALCSVDRGAPRAAKVEQRIRDAETLSDLLSALLSANRITVRDTGKGMSRDLLNDVYLKIGTPYRLQNPNGDGKAMLGEKGLGRLSVMRLGTKLRVKTATAADSRWNVLRIDWEDFGRDLDQLVGDIPIEPTIGRPKEKPGESGTEITISGLLADWDKEKLVNIAITDFARLTDPFTAEQKFPVIIHFNGELVSIPSINKLLLRHAHATVRAEYTVPAKGPCELRGEVVYGEHRHEFSLNEMQLGSITEAEPGYLKSLGPFRMELYWFNRKVLKEDDALVNRTEVLKLVKEWAGGLMVFRDGFRVNPYGSLADDWLKLDPDALGAQGYKVNRRQIIGRVEISRTRNPRLHDQTNREGLRDCPEKEVLILLLRHIVGQEFREYITALDDEEREQRKLSFDELEERLRDSQVNLGRIARKLNAIPSAKPLAVELLRVGGEIADLVRKTQDLGEGLEEKQSRLVHLAGLGLLLEILGHELHRITNRTLESVRATDISEVSPNVRASLKIVEAQLKTLEKRLRILDPLATPGRQRKEDFDLVEFVDSVIEDHRPQFDRHEVHIDFRVRPDTKSNLRITAVKGMFVQILENLISNSLYWFRMERKQTPDFKPEIRIVVDVKAKRLTFEDNGPGVAEHRKDRVFEPFYTTKSAKTARGLGLYISRELAKYHGARLFLDSRKTGDPPALHTFVLDIESSAHEPNR
jgi:signal transduction histidine kinase